MKLLAIDPAAKSGVAIFEHDRLVRVGTLRRRGTSGAYAFWRAGKPIEVWPSHHAAWQALLSGVSAVACEQAWVGTRPSAALSLARRTGFIEALAASGPAPTWREVTPSEWRRVARETWHRRFAWPTDRESKKALACALVRERWGVEVTDDEADAVLIGWWSLMTRATHDRPR